MMAPEPAPIAATRVTTMIVSDVMTRNIISVAPDATVDEAVRLMLAHDISGVCVVDEKGELAGVLTQGDLLRRDELGTQRHRPWWLRLFVSPARMAAEFTHANGRYVSDVMTRDVLTVAHDASLEHVVTMMEHHRIKRLPVTQDGRIIGIATRSDLLRALIGHVRGSKPLATDDRTIRSAILAGLEAQPWAPMTTLNVTVAAGIVDLWGSITNEEERRAIRVIAENTAGAKKINDHLVYIEPYTGTVVDAPDDAP
jgi:CBS domain-containing protein